MATEEYDLNTNGGAGSGNATAANQETEISFLGDIFDATGSGITSGSVNEQLYMLRQRPLTSNLNTFIDTQPSLEALQTNIAAFYSSFPDVSVISVNVFPDGFLPGGLVPAGYSCLITYSTV